MRRVPSGIAFAAAVVAAGACAGEQPEGPPAREGVSRTDSAGVEIVTNDSNTVALTLVEELRIGVVEGGEAYQFHDVADVDVAADGTVVVFNRGSHSLRLYDDAGRFRREIGREGQGPGEFEAGWQYSTGVWGDTIVVAEWLGRAVTLTAADTTGAILATARGVDSPFFFRDETVVPAGDGRLRFTTAEMPEGSWDVAGERKQIHMVVREIDLASGEIGSELGRVPGRVAISPGQGVPYPGAPPFFDPRPLAALVRGGILTTPSEVYEVRLLAADARPRRIVRRGHPARPVDQEVREGFGRALNERGFRGRMMEAGLARSPQVAAIPPIDRLMATREGGFWVRRKDLTDDPAADLRRAGLSWDGADPRPSRWDGFAPDGAYVGTVQLPDGFTPHAWGPDWIAGVVEDELEVEYVVVLAIRELAAG